MREKKASGQDCCVAADGLAGPFVGCRSRTWECFGGQHASRNRQRADQMRRHYDRVTSALTKHKYHLNGISERAKSRESFVVDRARFAHFKLNATEPEGCGQNCSSYCSTGENEARIVRTEVCRN